MECPEIVKELVRRWVLREIKASAAESSVSLDVSATNARVDQQLPAMFTLVKRMFEARGTNFNIPSATIIASFSSSTTREPERVGAQESVNCSVCLESTSGAIIGTLPCRHTFHMRCLEKYLCDANKCPLCRATLRQGVDQADIEDTQCRQAVRSMLRVSAIDMALPFAESAMDLMVGRAQRDRSTWRNRNFGLLLAALADCHLRSANYEPAQRIAQNALNLVHVSPLQRAELLRLRANALAAANAMRVGSPGLHVVEMSEVEDGLLRGAHHLDPVPYQAQLGAKLLNVIVWSPEFDAMSEEGRQEFVASLQSQLRGGELRIHCL